MTSTESAKDTQGSPAKPRSWALRSNSRHPDLSQRGGTSWVARPMDSMAFR